MAETLESGAFQGLAVIGMGYGDKCLRPFRKVLVAQVHDSVLGSDVLGLEAGGHHSGAGLEIGHYLGFAAGRARRQGYEGPASFGEGTAVHEVVLSANAGVDPLPYRIRAHLAGKVYLYGGIDGAGLGILPYYRRIVGIRHVEELHRPVVVHRFVNVPGTHAERRHAHSRMHLLERIVHSSGLHEAVHAVGHGLCVQPQMPVVLEGVESCVRDTAYPYLQAGAVGYFRGHVASYGCLYGSRFAEPHVHAGFVAENRRAYPALMDKAVAVKVRHALVHLGYDPRSAFHRRNRKVG